jgi:hypothetical protein
MEAVKFLRLVEDFFPPATESGNRTRHDAKCESHLAGLLRLGRWG